MGLFNWASTKIKNQGSKTKGFVRRITSAEELEKNGEFIVGMVKQLSNSQDEVIQETFENAYQRMGLTEEKLAKTYASLLIRFNIFLFFGVLGVCLGVWYAFQASLGALASIGFVAYCLGHLFVCSFRMLQIRMRELVPVSYWLAVPNQWWPRPFKPLRKPRNNDGNGSRKLSDDRKGQSKSAKLEPKPSRDTVVNLDERRRPKP